MGIKIYIWNRYVGALVKTKSGVAFEFDPLFRKSGLNLSPINLPLDGKDVYMNETDWKATEGIPGVIYDSLPDRFGNNLLMAYFIEKGLTEKDMDVFSKLNYMGNRGMGALEFKPAIETDQTNAFISIEEIERISFLGTKSKEALLTNLHDNNSLMQILHIGTSAGGARAKALIAINNTTGQIKSGQLPLDNEYTYYLIKIDGANNEQLAEPSGFGRLEYTYAQMAMDCGIQMTKCSLYNNTHFLTQRFDRDEKGQKIHTHSLCGLLGLDYNMIGQYSYEQYFMAARKLGLGQDALEEIFRRMVFNVLAHNCDDHTKNFSFMMDQTGTWALSPAFDICYSYSSSNEWVNGHNMRINSKRNDITFEDLMTVGEKFNLKKRKTTIENIQSVIENFKQYAKNNDVDQKLIDEVERFRPRIVIPN